ncbi:hypothetical protein HGM15179_021056 [Zosterops borbonicus]|uniref:Uncharacterized protein n=1 Tax=Zosterops borbonicus TaxID=364589 RepID=A0A8K1FTL0_9PASS|nr:hypothetical protein HGM15179_021056 [Zosterops borbonicus]
MAQGPPQEGTRAMRSLPPPLSPPQLLELLVAPVATLGELAATVTAPRRRLWPLLYPESLHTDLRKFIWILRDTLDHGNVTPLGQAVAALKATPGATWANVRAKARDWREELFVFEDRWVWLSQEASRLSEALEEKAIAEATTEDTDEAATTGLAREEAVVATRQTRAGTRREQQMEAALELLERLINACQEAIGFPWKLLRRLWFIEAALEETEEAPPDVPETLVAMVTEAEWLWEAGARLTTRHLLVTLGEIDFLLSSRNGNSGGPGGSRGRAVAELCQRAIEDIPRLLEESDVTTVTSSGQ